MTLFGEKLKKIIGENEINIYRLSLRAGIERTIVHKIISASRIPDMEYVRKLVEALPVSPPEKDELLQAYNISKDGEFVYNRRNQMHRLVERMSAVQAAPVSGPATVSGSSGIGKRGRKAQIETVSGTLSVNSLIDDVLGRELRTGAPHVRFVVPYSYAFFYDMLFLNHHKIPELKAECLFEFYKTVDVMREKRNANLDVVSALAPFIMHGGDFSAYYTYSAHPEYPAAVSPMPYFIATSSEAVTLTADLQTAVVLGNPGAAACYCGIFDKMKAKAEPLIGRVATMEETVAFYSANLGKGEGVAGFGSHPCISRYYDRATLEAHMPAGLPGREQMIEMSMSVCDGMRALGEVSPSTTYFTVKGLELFAREGILQTIVENFFTPYEPAERADVISKMIADTESGKLVCRAIDTSKLKMPERFYTDVFSSSHINIVAGNEDGNINTVNIFEEGIVEAFHDFLVNAVNTDFLYTKEDTLKTLSGALELARAFI